MGNDDTPGSFNYIITHSGVLVSQAEGVPTLDDIVRSLSRLPRFAGHTRRTWSVLHHSVYVAYLVQAHRYSRGTVKMALLHDAHECVTGDIPRPVKPYEIRGLQYDIQCRIWHRYIQPDVYLEPEGAAIVKHFDHQALLAEALLVGPPMFTTKAIVQDHIGSEPDHVALSRLGELLPHMKSKRAVTELFRRCIDTGRVALPRT